MQCCLRFAACLALAVSLVVCSALPANAAVVYWDVNGATAGIGGSGTWNTVNAFWNTDATGGGGGTVAAWTNGNDAYFDGPSGTHTIAVAGIGELLVQDMQFVSTTPTDYVFNPAGNNNNFTFTGTPEVYIAAGNTATWNNRVVLASGMVLDKNGPGTLIFAGAPSNGSFFHGALHINDGVVEVNKSGGSFAIGSSGANVLVVGDGIGSAGSAVLRYAGPAGNTTQLANGTPVRVKSDGLIHMNSENASDTIGVLTIENGGSVVLDQGSLDLAGLFFEGGGSIQTNSNTIDTAGTTYVAAVSGGTTATYSGRTSFTSSLRNFSIQDDPNLDVEYIISAELFASANGGINKEGTGTLLLDGNSPNFNGRISSNAGVLLFGAAPNVAGNSSATLILTGGTIGSSGGDRVIDSIISLSGGNGFTAIGDGAFHFTNTTATDTTGGSTSQKTFAINNPKVTFDNAFFGPRGITKNGLGQLVFNGANSYTGTTLVNAGVLRLGHVSAIPGGIGVTGGTNNLNIVNGVVGLGADDMLRNLGVGTDQVQLTGSGGFAAYGAQRNVNFGGAAATITWGSGGFTPTGQTLVLGASDATHRVRMLNPINLGAIDRTVEVRNGAASVDAELVGALSGAGAGLIKTGAGTLLISSDASYTGATMVSAGTLRVNASLASSSNITVAPGARLEGTGTVSEINGAGLISPGTSPGILTATVVNPTGSLDFAFEFTATGSPDYSNASASINDVLHITGATPFTSPLTSDSELNLYLNVSDLTAGAIRGGFYVNDGTLDFLPQISDADVNIFVRGNGGGSNTFNGQNYYTLEEFDAMTLFLNYEIDLSTVAETADFAGGSVDGRVLQLNVAVLVVPEPHSALLLLGCGLMFWRRRRSG